MNRYSIESRATGFFLGVFEGETIEDALNAYSRDAGYRDFADASETIGETTEEARAGLSVRIVD